MSDIIQTERLEIARARRADAAEIAPLVGDLAVSRWTTQIPHPYTLADAVTFTDRVEQEGQDHFIVRAAGVLVGAVSASVELGYWFGVPFWGRGYATEACRGVIAHRFARTPGDLPSGHFVENTASRRVLDKLGFEATHRENAKCLATGTVHVLQKMMLSRAAWEARS